MISEVSGVCMTLNVVKYNVKMKVMIFKGEKQM